MRQSQSRLASPSQFIIYLLSIKNTIMKNKKVKVFVNTDMNLKGFNEAMIFLDTYVGSDWGNPFQLIGTGYENGDEENGTVIILEGFANDWEYSQDMLKNVNYDSNIETV